MSRRTASPPVGLRFIRRSPIVRAALGGTATVNFFTFAFTAVFVLFATTGLGGARGPHGPCRDPARLHRLECVGCPSRIAVGEAHKAPQATALVTGRLDAATDALSTATNHLASVVSNEDNHTAASSKNSAILITIGLGVLSVLLGIVIVLLQSRRIVGGVRQMLTAAQNLAQGDVDQRLDVHRRDGSRPWATRSAMSSTTCARPPARPLRWDPATSPSRSAAVGARRAANAFVEMRRWRRRDRPRHLRYLRHVERLQPADGLHHRRGRTLRSAGSPRPSARASSPRRRTTGAALIVLTVALGAWFAYSQARARSARQTFRQAAQLVQQERYGDAYVVMRQLEPRLSRDREFTNLRDSIAVPLIVRTSTPGAELYVKPYHAARTDWYRFGQSPLETWGAFALLRWRVTKPGFTPVEGSRGAFGDVEFALVPEGAVPAGMVYVPEGTVDAANNQISLDEYFIDRYEVTNREYKRFIDAGGYRKREYWTVPFVKNGRTLDWEDAVAEFRDATGRPGPATWELGTYPDGQDDYPVHGVSWYEAAAFARFAGKMLPTVHHWRRAAGLGIYSDILEFSNFGGKGPARIGEFAGIGPYGTFDMAGNVKEWCWNLVGDKRYILGGGWNEPSYQFREGDARLPFDQSSNNGFRAMTLKDASMLPAELLRPVERLTRDYAAEKPVNDEVFRAYTSLYGYDRTELRPVVESVDDTSPSWRVERITFASAYGTERIIAYLFLPRNASPYQTVVYFPHGTSLLLRSFEKVEMSYLGFLVKAGRALLLPMYKGTYERRFVPPVSGPNAVRDATIQQMKDLRRSIDYLEARPDLDRDRLAYFGVSFGARLGSLALALDKRFKAAVLWSGGLPVSSKLPEVDELNYAPRVTTPVLMLNGRDDFTFPIESSQLPMFRLLGTPDKDKQRVLYDGGHVFPFARVEKDTLDWLDRYLGVPK